MSTQTRSGFTIIEVMLFLAISGALTVSILVGSGVAIGQQRYRDSVNTFKGLIQEQYSQITNVVNSDGDNPVCSPSGTTLDMSDQSNQARGTSDCLVMGRFLIVEETKVTAYDLIGQPPTAPVKNDSKSDVTELKSYFMAVQSPEVHDISWGARIVQPKSTNGMIAGILIIRSPISGTILTYTKDLKKADIVDSTKISGIVRSVIDESNTAQKDFCVDSEGGTFGRTARQAVRIKERATNQSGVEIPLENTKPCDQ